MESLKAYAVEWLDWIADYVRKDPQDFFSKLFMILLPLFILSGVLAALLLREIQKEEKQKQKKEKKTQMIKKARRARKKNEESKKES